jgi:hypothetical protein
VKVHLAATAREANEIIAGIARDNSAIVTIIGLGLFLQLRKPPTVWRFSGVAPTEQITGRS